MTKRILLTGASGFLGNYIKKAFDTSGFLVDTIGRSNSTVQCDLSSQTPQLPNVYQVVVHAAGKAHMVPKTEVEKQAFFDVNLQGTKHLISAIEASGQVPQTFVFISTIGVYGLDKAENITEAHSLNATDPYGQSKIQAEAFVREWCTKNGIAYFNLRLPLISGANPPGNLGSMIKALKKGYYFRIGKGSARKSIVLAEDVAAFLPSLFENKQSGEYNLTDGVNPTFAQIEDKIAHYIGSKVKIVIPAAIAKLIATVGDFIPKFPLKSRQYNKITSTLTFSDEKARKQLNWVSRSFIDTPVT